MVYVADIVVTLKKSILDPQGDAVRSALRSMGYTGVQDVRIGKRIEVRLEAASEAECRQAVDEMCSRLLANTVVEAYDFSIKEAPRG
ncbi:MAG TPA: phosphoribosylformylglycinamidine synthase subunit PurS [Bacillota bacterium]|nr:phosphoribosylformylglycinamidine synthase subunit PurS [Bacillota bacterium]